MILPALARRLQGRSLQIALAPAGASGLPRFDLPRHLAALAADPPAWPERTDAASILALDLIVGRTAFGVDLPSQRVRVELLDYPGEWLLDLPLLRMSFSEWSASVLRRLEGPAGGQHVQAFMAFNAALPAGAAGDEALAATGHRLYRTMLQRQRDQAGLSLLQPGRFLMPAPGPEPVWMPFFPHIGTGGLQALLARRYDAYVEAVRQDLNEPMFGNLDRIVVLADLLTALHAGPVAFGDAADAVGAAAQALRWQRSWMETVWALGRLRLPPPTVSRVAFAATKADHVADRQRGNLASLLRNVVTAGQGADVRTGVFALAAVRCTEDFVWTLEGRPVSAVRGRRIGDDRMTRSYPGEVPDRPPDDAFWAHPFLQPPEFEPLRLPDSGRGGVAELGLDSLLAFILDDVL